MWFEMFDTDKSGEVTLDDMLRVGESLGDREAVERMQELFADQVREEGRNINLDDFRNIMRG